jgi:hypothetical protein
MLTRERTASAPFPRARAHDFRGSVRDQADKIGQPLTALRQSRHRSATETTRPGVATGGVADPPYLQFDPTTDIVCGDVGWRSGLPSTKYVRHEIRFDTEHDGRLTRDWRKGEYLAAWIMPF